MPARLLGAHMHIGKGLGHALREGKKIGCAAVQVFTSSPQQWYSKPVTQESVADFKKARVETGITEVVSHDSYLVNLCAPTEEIREKSEKGLIDEMLRCHLYGIGYVVSHMGSHKGCGEAEGIQTVAEAATRVLEDTPDDVMLLMETTAGQGSALNFRFEQLAQMMELIAHPRLGVCLDTCHIFVAGYEIRDAENYEKTFEDFDRLIGLEHLKVIHCNDSKKGLGSKVDRHAHIGEGELGDSAFRLLVNDPRFENTPILLETPDGETMHSVNLERLRSLIAVA